MFDIIPEPLAFEWDTGNIDKSLKKHEVKNEEAEQVFANEPLIVEDTKHSTASEQRFHCLGQTDKGKELFISFTVRKNKVRIISARRQSRRERKIYGKEA